MSRIWNVSWKELVELARSCQRYLFVAAIFVLFVFYHNVVAFQESAKKAGSSLNQSASSISWDITPERPVKSFPGLQVGSEGWYRVGVFAVANKAVRVDIYIHSLFNEDRLVGSFNIMESSDAKYYEAVFFAPLGAFSDMKFSLHVDGTDESYLLPPGVKFSGFFTSRLDVQNKTEADQLVPTLVGGGILLSNARVEDSGKELLYSYSLSEGENDFFDLLSTEGSVKFDTKKKRVTGVQREGTSFMYRFFTLYPFKTFNLTARQIGTAEKEVKLEYSFDNLSWKGINTVQETDGLQTFSLVLFGAGKQDTVYVRASYTGEEKNTGSFGLDQLSVRAQLIRK